jgi:hypothetical protein
VNINLQFTLNADDLTEFQRSFANISKGVPRPDHRARGQIMVVGWVLVLTIAVGLFFIMRNDPRPATVPASRSTPMGMIVSVLQFVFLGFIIWFFVIRLLFSKSVGKRMLRKNPQLAERQEFTLAEQNITSRTATSTTTTQWSHFVHLAETKSLFVLLSGGQVSLMLPKRAFASPQEIDEFRGFAQAHIGNTPIGFPVQIAAPTDSPGPKETT